MNVLRNLTISVAFYGKFVVIWWKKTQVKKREQTADVGVKAIGQHRVKKNVPFERKILFSVLKITWRKILFNQLPLSNWVCTKWMYIVITWLVWKVKQVPNFFSHLSQTSHHSTLLNLHRPILLELVTILFKVNEGNPSWSMQTDFNKIMEMRNETVQSFCNN